MSEMRTEGGDDTLEQLRQIREQLESVEKIEPVARKKSDKGEGVGRGRTISKESAAPKTLRKEFEEVHKLIMEKIAKAEKEGDAGALFSLAGTADKYNKALAKGAEKPKRSFAQVFSRKPPQIGPDLKILVDFSKVTTEMLEKSQKKMLAKAQAKSAQEPDTVRREAPVAKKEVTKAQKQLEELQRTGDETVKTINRVIAEKRAAINDSTPGKNFKLALLDQCAARASAIRAELEKVKADDTENRGTTLNTQLIEIDDFLTDEEEGFDICAKQEIKEFAKEAQALLSSAAESEREDLQKIINDFQEFSKEDIDLKSPQKAYEFALTRLQREKAQLMSKKKAATPEESATPKQIERLSDVRSRNEALRLRLLDELASFPVTRDKEKTPLYNELVKKLGDTTLHLVNFELKPQEIHLKVDTYKGDELYESDEAGNKKFLDVATEVATSQISPILNGIASLESRISGLTESERALVNQKLKTVLKNDKLIENLKSQLEAIHQKIEKKEPLSDDDIKALKHGFETYNTIRDLIEQVKFIERVNNKYKATFSGHEYLKPTFEAHKAIINRIISSGELLSAQDVKDLHTAERFINRYR